MINKKRVGSAGRSSYALESVEPRRLLSASAAVQAGIAAIPTGLQSQLFLHMSTSAKLAAGATGPYQNTITVAEMRGAYGITGTGAGQTIAIIDAYDDPNALLDLNTFDAAYGLPAPASFTKVTQYGTPITANVPGDDNNSPEAKSDTVETSLDVQWAHAIAPDASILLVECNSLSNTDLFTGIATAADAPGVSVVSMSFGSSEYAGELSTDSVFSTPIGHQGVTFVASAGDTGAFAPDASSPVLQPNYPATSSHVVAVGGTNLQVGPNNVYGGETGWGNGDQSYLAFDENGNPLGGGGGGISAFETAPAYQTFATSNVGSGMRVEPDVAMEGGPDRGVSVVDSYYTGDLNAPWIPSQIYGTSLSAPMFAGVVADADTVRVSSGMTTLDGTTQTLPHLYELPSNAFHDVTQGNNGYQAGPGYDLVTGRGSPAGQFMIADLAANYIGYHVFDDVNIDGVQEAGEGGISGVTVELESLAGVVLQTTTTDSNGFYQFLDPVSGSYLVHFVTPAGFQISPLGTGTGTTPLILQNTANPATGNASVTITGSTFVGQSDDPYANCGMFTETISITDASIQRPQSGTANMTFTVTVNPQSTTTTFQVPYTTVDGTSIDNTTTTGPATVAHNDYHATSGTLVFAPGVTSETITVVIVGNTLIEKDLIFTVQLNPPATEFDLADSKTTGTGTIVNTSFPSVSIAATAADTLTRSDTQTQVMLFSVTLSAAAPFPVTVAYTTTDVTAVATVDYVTSTGTLTFTPDATTGLTPLTEDIMVSILPGTNPQLTKVFAVNVAALTGATTGMPSQVEGTIISNVPPQITAVAGEVTESLTGTALLPFQITVAPSLSGPVTINYATADGTAVAGVDYQAVSGTLTLNPGRIQQTVFVPVYRQFLSQTDKTLSFTISNPTVTINLVTPTVTGTIHYLPVTTLPISRAQKAVYTDTLGQRVTVGLSGPGSGQIVFLGSDSVATNAYELSFTGTTAASNVSVSVPGGGQTTVNSIVVDGSLNTLSAKAVNLQQGVVSVSGTINSLIAGYLSATTVTLGGTAGSRPVSINLRRAVDSPITSGAPIRTLIAGAYIDTTPATPVYITAPSVGTVRVSGNFGGTIRTSGTVAALDVGGTITGGIEAGQGIGSVVADSLTGAVLTAGTDGQPGTVTSATFSDTAAKIGRVQVRSTFSSSLIASSHVGRITIGSVASTSSGTPFGIVGNQIASVRTTTGNAVNVANPQVQFKLNDFEVDLI